MIKKLYSSPKFTFLTNTLIPASTPCCFRASDATIQYCEYYDNGEFLQWECEKQSTLCRFICVLFSYRFISNMQLCVILFRYLMHDNHVRSGNSTNTTHFSVDSKEQTLKFVLYIWAHISSYALNIFKREKTSLLCRVSPSISWFFFFFTSNK